MCWSHGSFCFSVEFCGTHEERKRSRDDDDALDEKFQRERVRDAPVEAPKKGVSKRAGVDVCNDDDDDDGKRHLYILERERERGSFVCLGF